MLRRPVAVGIFFLSFAAVGLVCCFLIPVELSPHIELPQITVVASWHGVSTETIERQVTIPLEAAMQNLKGVAKLNSTTSEGFCWLTAEFLERTNVQLTELELNEKIQQLRKEWPREVSWPVVRHSVPHELRDLEGFMSFQLLGNCSVVELRKFAEGRLRIPMLSILGVEKVEIIGGEEQTLHIGAKTWAVDRLGWNALWKMGLGDMYHWRRHSLGRVRQNEMLIDAYLDASIRDWKQVQTLPALRTSDSRFLRMEDIANVQLQTEIPLTISRVNGRNLVTLVLTKEQGVDLLETASNVEQKIALLKEDIPSYMDLIKNQDKSKDMRKEIDHISKRISFSLLFISLLLFVVFRRGQAISVIVSSVLLSSVGAVMLFYFFGGSLNPLVFAGFTVGFGILVDNAVVMYDHIYRRTIELDHYGLDDLSRINDSVMKSVRDIRQPLLAANFTTLGALLPIFFFSPELQFYFKPFAVSLGATLLISLFVSFTLIPVFLYHSLIRKIRSSIYEKRLGKNANRSCKKNGSGSSLTFFSQGNTRLYSRGVYIHIIDFCTDHPRWIVFILLWMIGFPIWLFPDHIPTQSEPTQKEKIDFDISREDYNAWMLKRYQNNQKFETGDREKQAVSFLNYALSMLANQYNEYWQIKPLNAIKPILFTTLGGVTYPFFNNLTLGAGRDYNSLGESSIIISIEMPNNVRIDKIDRICKDFEEQLIRNSEYIERIETDIHSRRASIHAYVKKRYEDTNIPIELHKLLTLYGTNIGGISLAIEGEGPAFLSLRGLKSMNLAIQIKGYNFSGVQEIAEKLVRKLENYKRVKNINMDRTMSNDEDQYEIVAKVQFARSAALTLDHELITREIQTRVMNNSRSVIEVDGDMLPTITEEAEADQIGITDLEQSFVSGGRNQTIRLDYITDIQKSLVLPEIVRENQSYKRLISFDVMGPDYYALNLRDKIINDTELPYGYSVGTDYSLSKGEFDEDQQRQLVWGLLVAVLVVWMITAALFESWTIPFLILLAIPLSLIGALYGFNHFHIGLNKGTYAAVLLLVGLVVNHSILLVDSIKRGLKDGDAKIATTVSNAAYQRIRPIFITTTTTIAGVLPLLFYETENSPWFSLGVGVCGGLITSFALTLIIIPSCFIWASRRKDKTLF